MLSYIAKRFGFALLALASVMVLTFLLFQVSSGDIAGAYLGPKASPESRAAFEEKYHLDWPLINPIWHKNKENLKFYQTQLFLHIYNTVTFKGKSFATGQTLWEIVRERGAASLALSVPILALGWFSAMIVSCFVAYYRGTWIDHIGVFICVLGMCIPYLAYMIFGQMFMFWLCPTAAWGIDPISNIYLPVAIAVLAGLGSSVRFYRTVILNEINQDYVRTARAKGVPLPGILFKHVLKNCMLPILTNLVMVVPFLILGNLLLENFFGIHGLGDLMINSISTRDIPIIYTLTFWTALLYISALFVTDVLYAVFDPRIRLR
ncbi:MAG TPA: ABC transporter permease [Phycisphaerae bacterium]|nr:ABC transporter permease [Phycisphaerae bacterium]